MLLDTRSYSRENTQKENIVSYMLKEMSMSCPVVFRDIAFEKEMGMTFSFFLSRFFSPLGHYTLRQLLRLTGRHSRINFASTVEPWNTTRLVLVHEEKQNVITMRYYYDFNLRVARQTKTSEPVVIFPEAKIPARK